MFYIVNLLTLFMYIFSNSSCPSFVVFHIDEQDILSSLAIHTAIVHLVSTTPIYGAIVLL